MKNMLHLIKLEWLKLRKFTTFRVLAAMYFIGLPGMFLMGLNIQLPKEVSFNLYMFPNVWNNLAYLGSWICFFLLGFIAVVSITSEFRNKTLRQNIITGMSRTDFWKGKVAIALTISLVATLYFCLIALTTGFFNTKTIYLSKVFQDAGIIPRYFLMCFGYMSFGMLIGYVIKRTGISLFLYLAYIVAIEPFIRYVLHYRAFENRSVLFYPMNAIEDLTPIPFLDIINEMARSQDFDVLLSPTEATLTASIFIGLFLLLSYKRFTSYDL